MVSRRSKKFLAWRLLHERRDLRRRVSLMSSRELTHQGTVRWGELGGAHPIWMCFLIGGVTHQERMGRITLYFVRCIRGGCVRVPCPVCVTGVGPLFPVCPVGARERLALFPSREKAGLLFPLC